MFTLKCCDGNARAGLLRTAHGAIETPFLMPVATKGSVKLVSMEELTQTATDCIICNAFLFSLKPGLDLVEKAGGLHEFINWEKGIFTDSGGFQILSKEFLIKIDSGGVHFRDPFQGSRCFLTPEKAVEIQKRLGSDVAMCLDDVPEHGSSVKRIEKAVVRTTDWAKRCREQHSSKKQLLFGICQGGTSKKLRKRSAAEIVSLDFDGVALGGLCIGESMQAMYEMVELCNKTIPKEKPRYLMGVGSPRELIECIERGIDAFDSCFPTRTARHGLFFTRKGNFSIERKGFASDLKPLDKECRCVVCRNYSRALIHHLFKTGEENGLKYLSLHNLFFVQNLMEEARQAIRNGKFAALKKRLT